VSRVSLAPSTERGVTTQNGVTMPSTQNRIGPSGPRPEKLTPQACSALQRSRSSRTARTRFSSSGECRSTRARNSAVEVSRSDIVPPFDHSETTPNNLLYPRMEDGTSANQPFTASIQLQILDNPDLLDLDPDCFAIVFLRVLWRSLPGSTLRPPSSLW
jgi:hypothetical protein